MNANIGQGQKVELEYKFLVEGVSKIKALLDTLSQRKLDHQYQNSVMFDNPQGLMQTTDGRVRVRTKGNDGNKVLTYKKPLLPENNAKKEIEYEVEFEDLENQIEKLLEVMEFTPTTSYERYQTKWEIDNVHVTLDEYPYASFLELEGQKDPIETLAKKLGFKLSSGLTSPVDTLFQEWRKKQGLPFKPHLRFDDFNK